MGMKQTVALILHNIRSTHNVGSLFRTADCAGVGELFLCGYTPTPIDRFGRARSDVAKVALGAEKTIPWQQHEDTLLLLKKLKKDGYRIIALEQSERSVHFKKIIVEGKTALVVGNEVGGIEEALLAHCDDIAEIPMAGEKESLNVSVAAGVALFAWLT
jgi:23S rRNA (guanosine2251-2'-O)-methyltransferase